MQSRTVRVLVWSWTTYPAEHSRVSQKIQRKNGDIFFPIFTLLIILFFLNLLLLMFGWLLEQVEPFRLHMFFMKCPECWMKKEKCTESCKRKFRKIGLSASKESLDTVFCHIFLAIHFYKNSSSTARWKPHTFKEKYSCNFPLLLLLHNYTKKITRMGPPPTANLESAVKPPPRVTLTMTMPLTLDHRPILKINTC